MYWPDTVVFWGAGATASLNFPTTDSLGSGIGKMILCNNNVQKLIDAMESSSFCQVIAHELADFLSVLYAKDLGDVSDCAMECGKRIFPSLDSQSLRSHIINLRFHYDWYALTMVGHKICQESLKTSQKCDVNDLYNAIDDGLSHCSGIVVQDGDDVIILEGSRLKNARTLLDAIQMWRISSAYQSILENDPKKLNSYIKLAEDLATLMQEEGVHQESKNVCSRDFYLFSYAVISLNYDPLLIWLLFNAHKKFNDDNPPCVTKTNRSLKLFHDFSLLFGIREIYSQPGQCTDSNKIWYPANEGAVQRINGYENLDRIMRIGKFYYPHGNLGFRRCPNCSKLNIKLGDQWENHSKSLFYNYPFASRFNSELRTPKEKEAFEKGFYDAIECPFCGTLTYGYNGAFVTQSSFKKEPPSFLREMEDDLKVTFAKAKHIVLMGYSLPKDDALWRTYFLSKKGKGDVFCSVVVGYKGEKRWINFGCVDSWLSKCKEKDESSRELDASGITAVETAMEIFGKENVRIYAGGIPQVFHNGIDDVRALLYPGHIFK